MKTSTKISVFIILVITTLWAVPQRTSAQNENISLQVFYDELGNYGTWIDNPDFGYVWVPNVQPGFRPYVTNGHWVFTDYGWTWSSNYPWGWAAFHYGRWYWDEQYGNVWVPDTEWGPAWVIWRQSPGYYGWAPMSPGMSIGTSYGRNNIPLGSWCFVRDRDLMRYDIGNYFIDRFRYSALIGVSSLLFNIHIDARYNYSYVYGPERGDFQRRYGRAINPIRIYDNDRPGQYLRGDRYSIYRPQFNRRGDAYRNSRPSNFLNDRERINNNPNYNNNRNSDYHRSGRSNASDNNNSNFNNRSNYNNGSGRVTQQPTVNNPQNDRERINVINNNTPANRNSDQQQNNNGRNNAQRDNFNNHNQSGANVNQQIQTVNQNQRDANRSTTPTFDNSQRMNQQGRNQGGMNSGNVNRPAQPMNNVQPANNTQPANQQGRNQENMNRPAQPINNTQPVNQREKVVNVQNNVSQPKQPLKINKSNSRENTPVDDRKK